jgi:two-component system, LytTR family, sensor histidine kinase AlgZ
MAIRSKYHGMLRGDVKDKFIVPLLLLPFLENAFKHGASEQIENPWIGVDISVNNDTLLCKISNSKNEFVKQSNNCIGINNVKKRLSILYKDKHDLEIIDNQNLFVVSMTLVLTDAVAANSLVYSPLIISKNLEHETTLPAYR